ncbi:hypothetical protein Tco_1124194 [Tanacetum coccineum]|uniref:Uncharacterized protein n=1 Tax=Tanacetum coccineum TaxID=301880 RepID=A0ABQ5J5J9_9ASTR
MTYERPPTNPFQNPPNIIYEHEVASLRAQAKQLFGNENIWVEMHPCIAWDKVVNQTPQNTLPSKIDEPYEPSPRMDSYDQPSCLGSNFVSKTLRRSDQMHQLFEKSSLAMTRKLDDIIELPKSQPKRTYMVNLECEIVRVKIPKCMVWLDDEPIGDPDMMEDKVDNPSPQSTPQVLPSFEVYTLPVTYPEEVDETIGILMEVEPLDHTKQEDLGLNNCNHDITLSFREIPSVDEPEPQPLPNILPLDVNLGDKRGTDPPINPYSSSSFRMKVVKPLTIHTPPLPHVAYFHRNGVSLLSPTLNLKCRGAPSYTRQISVESGL